MLERKQENRLKERKLRRLSTTNSVMDWFPLTYLNIVQNIGCTLFCGHSYVRSVVTENNSPSTLVGNMEIKLKLDRVYIQAG